MFFIEQFLHHLEKKVFRIVLDYVVDVVRKRKKVCSRNQKIVNCKQKTKNLMIKIFKMSFTKKYKESKYRKN